MVTDRDFIKKLIVKGCRLFFFSDYVPVQKDTEDLALTEAQRAKESCLMTAFRSEFHGLFVAFPGDEKALGGCLGAGRGLIHLSTDGQVEPCPAVPFSDVNLKEVSLKDALQSEFLRKVREDHPHWNGDHTGCTLWEYRERIASLLNRSAEIHSPEYDEKREILHFPICS